jgi:enamine deaminase RidA (YjgF/YER057c/UK114 family)
MARHNISSGSPFEPTIGFSRAVRIGDSIAVSGTAPLGPDGQTVHAGDAFQQTLRCLEIIIDAVVKAGGRKDDIIRTRVYLTDLSRWKEAARAHGEVFSEIRPASTFLEIKALIDPAWIVEIEADAVVTGTK